jgi:hypothetical protein
LSLAQQVDAVHKFEPIADFVTTEERCFNCHGGVNPHIDGAGKDPGDKEAPPSLKDHAAATVPRDNVKGSAETRACRGCHNNMVPRADGSSSVWMTAPGFLSFIGKDAPTLCKQIKGHNRTAERFLGHLKDDNGGNNFGGTAFAGGCGLEPQGPFEEERLGCKPPSISHDALQKLGKAWVDAMGEEKFNAGDMNCGCEVRLKGKFTSTDTGDLGPMRNVIKVTGDLVWKKTEDDGSTATSADTASMSFEPVAGEITVEMEFENRGLEGRSVCKGSGRKSFPVASIAEGALRLMKLDISDDGSYEVMLVIPDVPDPFPAWSFDSTCTFPNVAHSQPVEVRHTSVLLGKQQGVVDEQRGIAGQLAKPIRRGPRTITGSWSFDTQGTP